MVQNKSRLMWLIFGAAMLALVGVSLLLRALTTEAPTNPANQSNLETPLGDVTTDPALTQPAPSPSPLNVPQTPTITIKGVEVQNFLSTSQSVDSQGTVVLREDSNFSILYFPTQEQFLISITGTPFEMYRQQAETFLVAALNVPEQQACRLTIEISTPAFANPAEAGTIFGLSFCR